AIGWGGGGDFGADREVFKVVYDDQNARLLVAPIHTSFTRITGNPDIFQGSLFVPSGNILWKWTPGQLEFTPIPVDALGDMPANRGGGVVTALKAIANRLMMATQSGPDITGAYDSCLLGMDANNTFEMVDYSKGPSPPGVVMTGQAHHLCWFVDGFVS